MILVRPFSMKTESYGIWRPLAYWMVKHQMNLSFSILLILYIAQFIPITEDYAAKLFTLSYYNYSTQKYSNGIDDLYLIICFIIMFTALRATTMDYVLAPFAKMWGVHKQRNLDRFCEQAWLICYYSVFWTMGVYIYYNSSYFLNLKELWTNWPDRQLTGLVKFYILAQWSFWLQQIIVINIEKRRKDYVQMLAHHLVTSGLIHACYVYHQTRVGNLILILMDIVDIVLPLAKCLKYMGFKTVCEVTFGVLLGIWIITRHILYPMVCWSVYSDIPRIIGETCWQGTSDNLDGPFITPTGYRYLLEPFMKSDGVVCFNSTLRWAFLVPLLVLEAMAIVWLAMILRVAAKVFHREEAEDSRSDDEGVEANEQVEECRPLKVIACQNQQDVEPPNHSHPAKRHVTSSIILSLDSKKQ